jgi:hypothetical protein
MDSDIEPLDFFWRRPKPEEAGLENYLSGYCSLSDLIADASRERQLRTVPLCVHARIGRSCGICLAPGFYVRAMAVFEVMLALTFPSLRSGARCAPMAAFNLRCVPVGNVARDGASGVAARALAA